MIKLKRFRVSLERLAGRYLLHLPLEQFQNAAPAASYLSVTQIICPHLAAAGTDRGICDLLVKEQHKDQTA
jgi:hypothetical protein